MIWSTNDLNPQWPTKPLASLTTKVGSGATPRGGRASYADHGVPLIRSQNVLFEGFNPDGLAFLTDTQARQLDGVTVRADDVLLNITGASIGRVCIAPQEMDGARVNQHVCIIRSSGVQPAFLANYLASPQVQDAIRIGNYGATREALTKSQILELPVPVPSAAEQAALIARVAELSAQRSRVLQSLSTTQRAIQRLRPAALAAAYRTAVQKSTSEACTALSALLREPLKNGYSAKPVAHETPFRVLTLSATTSGWFDERQFKYTEESFDSDSPNWIDPGDILVQRGNTAEYVGVPALYEGEPHQFIYPDLMIRVRVLPDISARYVWYMLLAPQARQYLRAGAAGSAGNMPKINQKVLATAPVPVPPRPVRDALVTKLDGLFAAASNFEARTRSVGRSVRRSSSAVLAKTFRGQLLKGAEVDAEG